MKNGKNSTGKIKIKLVRSPIGYKYDQLATVKALGLKRMNHIKEIENNSVSQGMIFKVKHLVKIVD